jgi:RNA polymerase sigma-70 factor, ECF subfamily
MMTWHPIDDVKDARIVAREVGSMIPLTRHNAIDIGNLEQAYQELSPALRAYLTRKVGNADQADDLAQETFYRALKAFQGGRGWLPSTQKEYRPWLFRIATNLAIDLLRRRTCLTWCDLEAAAAVPTTGMDADPEEAYPHLEEAEVVRTTLGHLPDCYRRALMLHYHGGLTILQVAQAIGVSPGGCKMLLKRARHAFAQCYHEQREVSA